MRDGRPTWQLVLESAKELRDSGSSPFRLGDVIAAVQRRDDARARASIQPVIQGMTVNAGNGPASPCGKVLVRTGHGWYALAGNMQEPVGASRLPQTAIATRNFRVRLLSEDEASTRSDHSLLDKESWTGAARSAHLSAMILP